VNIWVTGNRSSNPNTRTIPFSRPKFNSWTSALKEGVWPRPRPGRFTPEEETRYIWSDTVFSPKEHQTGSSAQRLERPCAYKSRFMWEPKRRFTHSAYDTLGFKQTVWHPHTSLVCWWTSCRHLVFLASRWFINHYDHSNKSEITKWIDHHTHTHTHTHTHKYTNTHTHSRTRL
jgi:hypothetical protein